MYESLLKKNRYLMHLPIIFCSSFKNSYEGWGRIAYKDRLYSCEQTTKTVLPYCTTHVISTIPFPNFEKIIEEHESNFPVNISELFNPSQPNKTAGMSADWRKLSEILHEASVPIPTLTNF
jgi:hypothetical protein